MDGAAEEFPADVAEVSVVECGVEGAGSVVKATGGDSEE